ncbi:Glycoside hydrolase family 42 domain protein (fragment) [Verrucomicrobia bacterium]
MSFAQVAAVNQFVERGGSVVATGDTSRCNEWGEPQSDLALADLFGCHVTGDQTAFFESRGRWAAGTQHTYLRLAPEIASRAYGPRPGNEPAATGERHSALKGFDDTDILPFGGALEPLRVQSGALVLATFIPAIPAFPPEDVWMREPRTDIPALIVNQTGGRGRVAFLPADLDRRFGRDNLPDHATLLTNLVRWAARDHFPLQVEGPGFVDCHLYRQNDKLVLHLVNLTNAGTWRAPVDELIPVGPFRVRVLLPAGAIGKRVRLLVSKRPARA